MAQSAQTTLESGLGIFTNIEVKDNAKFKKGVTVESDAVFEEDVLIKKELEVQGKTYFLGGLCDEYETDPLHGLWLCETRGFPIPQSENEYIAGPYNNNQSSLFSLLHSQEGAYIFIDTSKSNDNVNAEVTFYAGTQRNAKTRYQFNLDTSNALDAISPPIEYNRNGDVLSKILDKFSEAYFKLQSNGKTTFKNIKRFCKFNQFYKRKIWKKS